MKISIVTDTYSPQLNGVAMTLKRLVDGLRKRGHQIDVIRPAKLDCAEAGMQVPSVSLPWYPEMRFGLPRRLALQARWLRNRPDVVYVASESLLGASAISAARSLRIGVATSFHTNFEQYMPLYQLSLLERPVMKYLRRLHNRSQCTFVPTPDASDHLRRQGFHNLKLLRKGVDTELYSPEKRDSKLRREWGLRQDSGIVGLHVGRLAVEKNVPAAIRAFTEIRRHRKDFRGIFVGDGPLREELSRKHPEFLFTGARFGEELAQIYASADLFVFPSLTETFGNVVLEAMASSLSVVAYDYAAARQHLRNGINGTTVPFDDETALIKASVAAAHDPQLPEKRSAARASVMPADWNSVVERFEKTVLDLSALQNPAKVIHEETGLDESCAVLSAV